MTQHRGRNARAAATSLLPEGYEARVLEPSPPAITDPDWYADDPTDPASAKGMIVTPIPGEGVTWDAMAETHPHLQEYASIHWLSGRRRLGPLPPDYATTRDSLHQLAFFAVAPKRHAATGKLGLRYTYRGFGTPFFANDEQVRIEAGELVHQTKEGTQRFSPATVGEACDLLGIPYRDIWFEGFHDPPEPIGPGAELSVDREAAACITNWFGFATLVLERFRRTPGAHAPTRVQLWPEHFDVAMEMVPTREGPVASYGASSGDESHPEPHFYVAPWREVDRSDTYWNDSAFSGASLPYHRLIDVVDPVKAALDFLTSGLDRLRSGSIG